MLRKSGIIFVMLIAVAILVTASASAVSSNTVMTPVANDWVVTPVAAGTSGASNAASMTKMTPVANDWVATPTTLGTSGTSKIASMGTFSTMSSGVNYIVQGQSSWYSFYVPSGTYGVTLDVNWGNSANSLQVTMYAADGSVAGPYYDSADGRIDGRICIYLSRNGAIIPSGTYYENVYGYKVSGSQSYTT